MLTRDHTVLPATHTFIQKWNEPYLPLLITPQPHSITALWPVLISCPAEGGRLSYWPGWLDEIPRWFVHPKTVSHSSTAAGNRTRDHLVASSTLVDSKVAVCWLVGNACSLMKAWSSCRNSKVRIDTVQNTPHARRPLEKKNSKFLGRLCSLLTSYI